MYIIICRFGTCRFDSMRVPNPDEGQPAPSKSGLKCPPVISGACAQPPCISGAYGRCLRCSSGFSAQCNLDTSRGVLRRGDVSQGLPMPQNALQTQPWDTLGHVWRVQSAHPLPADSGNGPPMDAKVGLCSQFLVSTEFVETLADAKSADREPLILWDKGGWGKG